MIIDCIADLHGEYPELEGGDLLIVAGDLTASNKVIQYLDFTNWLQKQDYKKKVVIAGNHDNGLEKGITILEDITSDRKSKRKLLVNPIFGKNIEYLCDSGTEFEGLKIWGSPWTRWFEGINPHCTAFTLKTEEELAEKWALIPDDIDILITHSPPYGIKDKTHRNELAGSKSLLIKCAEIKPLVHVFGHIHEQGGKEIWIAWGKGTNFVNASIMNEDYDPVNKPIRVIL